MHPDGDGLGSLGALRRWLEAEGKTVETVLPTPAPEEFLPYLPDDVHVAGRDIDVAALPRPDLVVVADTAAWDQLEGVEGLLADGGAPVLAIDHHRTRDPLADLWLVDENVAACVQIVRRLLAEADAPLDRATATDLFIGLVADTGWFRLPNAGPAVYRLAAELVEAGAEPHRLYEQLHQGEDLSKLRLAGLALQTIDLVEDGRVAVMRISQDLFRRAGTPTTGTGGLVNECLRIRGVKVGVLLVEESGGDVRVSLRCRYGLSILPVAERFGGGGHRRAAGFRLEAALAEAEGVVLEAVREVLDAPGTPHQG